MNHLDQFEESWVQGWLKADFSWKSVTKNSGFYGAGKSLAEEIRLTEGGETDTDLQRDGKLIEINGKLFHYLFLNRILIKKFNASLDPKKLDDMRIEFFRKTRSRLREIKKFNFSGISLDCKSIDELFKENSIDSLRFENVYIEDSIFLSGCENIYLNNSFSRSEISIRGHRGNLRIENSQFDRLAVSNSEAKNIKLSKSFSFIDFTMIESVIDNLMLSQFTTKDDIGIFNSEIRGDVVFDNDCECATLQISFSKIFGNFSLTQSKIVNGILMNCSKFERPVVFKAVEWPYCRNGAVSIGTNYNDSVTFQGPLSPPVSFFLDNKLCRVVDFRQISMKSWAKSFNLQLKSSSSHLLGNLSDEEHFEQLENSARQLRKYAEAKGDTLMEQFWHTKELTMREFNGANNIFNRVFSKIYYHSSNFGTSLGKPVLWLSLIQLVFSVIYAFIIQGNCLGIPDQSEFLQAFSFSLERMFPFFSQGIEPNGWRAALVGSSGSLQRVAVQMLAGLHTIIFAMFVFLLGLAIRRRFRIN
jgi:hypothetical protein